MLDSRSRTSTEDFRDPSAPNGSGDGTFERSSSHIVVFVPKVEQRTACASAASANDRTPFTIHDDELIGGGAFAAITLPTMDGVWRTLIGKELRIPEPGEAAPNPGVDKLWRAEVADASWSKVGIHDHQPGRKRYNPGQFVLEDEQGRFVVDAEGPDATWEVEDLEQAVEEVLTEFGLNGGCARRFLVRDKGRWLIWPDRGSIIDVDRALDAGIWYLSQDRPEFTDLPLDLQDAVGGPLSKIAWALGMHRYLEFLQIETSAAVAERRRDEIVRVAATDPDRATRYLLSLTNPDRGVSYGRFVSAVQGADIVNRDARAATSGANAERSKVKEQRLDILTRVYVWLGPDAADLDALAAARLVHAAYDNDEPITKGLDLRKEDPERPTETAKEIALVRRRLKECRAT
ncbi:MAG: hypothetical protein KKA16_14735 [Alphaproteobacteria bacterium]|nr:hypothetical protein [Alphaproteobacteria bacterium]MBU2379185.1 hypothetical protein [Alphaproteobacteria bacterium]